MHATIDSNEVNLATIVDEVKEQFSRYERALVDNDVETLVALFWHDSRVVRYGAGENLYGPDDITAFRHDRPTADLRRTLSRSVITTFGTDFATTSTEFTRTASGRRGRQTQVWVRTDAGWRIVAAHVSLLPAP